MGKNFSCVSAFEERSATPERRALEKVYDWLERLEKESDDDTIQLPRTQFKACMEYVKDVLNGTEDRSKLCNATSRIEPDINACFDAIKESDRPLAYLIDSSHAKAAKSFVDGFQERMKKNGILLSQKQISDTDRLDRSLFLILVCNASSRTEADIDACFNRIKGEVHNKIILIMLHVARRGKAPAEYTSKKLGNSFCSGRYSSVFSIIDMAFTIEDGIYECSMNEKAFTDLKNIFSDNSTKLKTQDPVKMNNTPCTGVSSNRDEVTKATESLLPKSVNEKASTDLQNVYSDNSTNLQTHETITKKDTLCTEDTSKHDEATKAKEPPLLKSVNEKASADLQNVYSDNSTNLQTQETVTIKYTLCTEDNSNHDEATEDTKSLLPN